MKPSKIKAWSIVGWSGDIIAVSDRIDELVDRFRNSLAIGEVFMKQCKVKTIN